MSEGSTEEYRSGAIRPVEPIPVKPAQPTSLTTQTYQRLRAMIISGELIPGGKLKIEDLRAKLGTGTSPIREALSLLTSDQLVERLDHRGFRVADVSVESFDELLKTRCWLEQRALRESIAQGDARWEENIVLAHHRFSRTPRSLGNKNYVANPEWEIQHKQFHLALLAACGSTFLLKFCDQLYDQNTRYRNITGATSYPKRYIKDEHEKIMKHALDRDADAAVDALMTHYNTTGSFLSKQIK
jgi:DNA-binding GntR family transcriptional regulator